jgi:hypothetical protein
MNLPELTRDSLIQYANDNGIILTKEGTWIYHPNLCLRAMMTYSVLGKEQSMYSPNNTRVVCEAYNITPGNLESIENGFEGFTSYERNFYYELGKSVRIALLA